MRNFYKYILPLVAILLVTNNSWATEQYVWVERFNGTMAYTGGTPNISILKNSSEYYDHVNFYISEINSVDDDERLDYSELKKGSTNSNSQFTWQVENNPTNPYEITVTKIECQVRAYSWLGGDAYAWFTNDNITTAQVECGTNGTGLNGSKYLSIENTNGLSSPVTINRHSKSRDYTFTLHNVRYTYLLTQRVPKFQYKAVAIADPEAGGNVYASFTNGSFSSTTATTTSYSGDVLSTSTGMTKTAYFKAEAKDGYNFVGWARSKDATEYISTSLTYSETIKSTSNDDANPTTLTLYAIFKSKNQPLISGSDITNIKVDETYTADYSFTHTITTKPSADDNADFYFTISHTPDESSKAGSPDASKVISYNPETNVITALNSGSATITFIHKETTNYFEESASYTVSVIKHTPSFTWHGQANTVATTEYFNTTYAPFFVSSSTTNNTSATLSYSSSDEDVANWSAGSTAQSLNLTTYNKEASTTLTVTQEENYYWYEKEEFKTVTPIDPNNHVPFTIDTQVKRDIFAIKYVADKYEWDNGIQLGNWEDGFEFDDKYVVLNFTGIPDMLSFNTSIKDVLSSATSIYWYVKESADGVNWSSEIWNEEGKREVSANIELDPNTRYIMLCYSGNYGAVFHNVTVTELNEFEAELSEADKGIIDDDVLDFGANPVNKQTYPTKTFDLRYANAGYKVSLSVEGDDRFTVSPTSINTIGGEKYGIYTPITVTYNTSSKHSSASGAKIVIEDEKGFYEEVLLIGSTYASQQNLSWTSAWSAEKPIVILNQTVTDAATNGMTDELPIKYYSSDETILDIADDGFSFTALKTGEAIITAYQEGNDEYAYAEISKTFVVTDKYVQNIVFEGDLTSLYVGDPDVNLTAQVYLLDAETYEWTFSQERTDLLTYSSPDPSIVSISGNVLSINNIGEIFIQVSVPGNELYEATSLSIPVRVREVPQGCEDVLLPLNGHDYTDRLEYDPYKGTENFTLEINRSYGIPGQLSFYYYGEKAWGTLDGEIQVMQSTDGGSTWTELITVTPTTTASYSPSVSLSREATHLRFNRINQQNFGYHYVQYISIIPAQYIESETIDFGNIAINSAETRNFIVAYSNIKDIELDVIVNNPILSLSANMIEDNCGAWGEKTLNVTLTPNQVGAFEDYIYIKDDITQITCTVKVVANVLKGTPVLQWNPITNELTQSNDWRADYTKNATSTIDVPIIYTMTPNSYAHFDADGRLVIDNAGGKLTITASQEESENFNAASISQEFTIPAGVPLIFIGGGNDRLWTTPINWNFNRLPLSNESVILDNAVEISNCAVSIHAITMNSSSSIHIAPTGGLTVGEGGVVDALAGSITIDNNADGVGYFRVDPDAPSKPNTVIINYTTRAKSGSPRDEVWQYVGAPGANMNMTNDGVLIYHWSEEKGWLQSTTAMTPFVGYAITRTGAGNDTYTITTTPIFDDHTIELTRTPSGMDGSNLFVNSYLAPIDLANFELGVDIEGDVEQTFYLFNSGSWNDWQNDGGGDESIVNGSSPGQYFAITPGSAAMLDASMDQTTIPPMQGVYVVANESAKIHFDYDKHIYTGSAVDMNRPMRAPQLQDENFMRVRIQVNSENSGADRMYVIQHEKGTRGYDNGYDAKNILAEGQANIYTHEQDGQMEISVTNRLDSTYIGFAAGDDAVYTLTFTSLVGEEMYLYDIEQDILIPLAEQEQYTFYAQPNSVNDKRFLLLLNPDDVGDAPGGDGVATGMENLSATSHVWFAGKTLYVADAPANSTLAIYSVTGMCVVASNTIPSMPYVLDLSHLPMGVYVLRLNNQAYKFVCE